jgi:exodeoxyribonuclease-3
MDCDILAIQETKMQKSQGAPEFEGFEQYWNSAIKKGYSGTAIYTKINPLSVSYGIAMEEHDTEGRVITLEMPEFFLINVYSPNSQKDLVRLSYRLCWEDAFRDYVVKLNKIKPVIICGDLNVAHHEIDLKNPNTNRKSAGFSDEERDKLTTLLKSGFIDSFRYLYPDKKDSYTWWNYLYNARAKKAGWRIDYFLVSDSLKAKITDSIIFSDIMGSDHCPVGFILS